jgi:hypothetical protein
MIVALVPLNGRKEITSITIPRLIKQVDKVILAVDDKSEGYKGADCYDWMECGAFGAKMQFLIERAREYSPDIVLISSSGGVFRNDYFDCKSDLTGPGCLYYLDFQPTGKRMIYWPGYPGGRVNEPVGLGRMFTGEFLEKCKWQIYDVKSTKGLDSTSMHLILRHEPVITIKKDNVPMRISSYKYVQLDSFDRMAKASKNVDKIDEVLKWYGLVL